MTAKGTEARVCQDIAARQAKGVSKYGTTVAENPLGMVQWLQHAYEEALDQAIYLKRAIEQLQGVPAPKEATVHLNLPVVEMSEAPQCDQSVPGDGEVDMRCVRPWVANLKGFEFVPPDSLNPEECKYLRGRGWKV